MKIPHFTQFVYHHVKQASLLASLFLLSAIFIQAQQPAPTASFNITDFGAVGDGTTLNTDAIQKAIDTCSAKGGGTVDFPSGRFLSGTIRIKDGVTLRLADGAVLLGSPKLSDYQLIEGFTEGLGIHVGYTFIIAVDAKNIGIEGPGEVDGQGKEIAAGQGKGTSKDWGKRPFLLRFLRCDGITLQNLKITGSGAWTMPISLSKNILIKGVNIESYGLPHNDGIDIDSCQNLQILDTNIHSGDDAICFKTLSPLPCQNITINNCKLQTGEGAIKFGTESTGAFANVTISNCQVISAKEGGIKLFSVDGAEMQNISVSDIKMSNVNLPIIVRLGARLNTFREGDQKQPVGFIKDIQIKNVEATNCTRIGILISGIPDHPVQNLSIQNVSIQLPGGGSQSEAKTVLPELEKAYPEVKMFGDAMPAYGAYIRHVQGLKIDGLSVQVASPDQRPAVFCQDAQDIAFTNWKLASDQAADSVLNFDSVKNAVISGFDVQGGASTFLHLAGQDSTGIRLTGNQLGSIGTPSQAGSDVSSGAVTVQ